MRNGEQASAIFGKISRNFMTPDWIAYRDVPPGASPWVKPIGKVVELAGGTGMENEPIYGVTVLDWNGGRTDESKMFHDYDEATDYFQEIE